MSLLLFTIVRKHCQCCHTQIFLNVVFCLNSIIHQIKYCNDCHSQNNTCQKAQCTVLLQTRAGWFLRHSRLFINLNRLHAGNLFQLWLSHGSHFIGNICSCLRIRIIHRHLKDTAGCWIRHLNLFEKLLIIYRQIQLLDHIFHKTAALDHAGIVTCQLLTNLHITQSRGITITIIRHNIHHGRCTV